MKQFVFPILSVFFVAVCLTACKEETVIPDAYQSDREYFPLTPGSWIEYAVDSIVHIENDPEPCKDSVLRYSFFLREEVDTPFIDGQGDLAYRIMRYKRSDTLQPWTFSGLWSSKKTDQAAQRVEDNVRIVKLSFPFDRRSSWNGNAYNTLIPESYRYDDIGVPYRLGSLSFEATTLVVQNDFITSISATVKSERFAKGIGLIEKYSKDVRLLYGCGSASVIDDGLEYSQRAIAFGKD
ncbi:MAG: hypothetical protein ACKO1U_05685 [Bacteroidota bacterium]